MNENKILGSNRLPGSEKLTRPEEIKSMSKYLRAIRETYEENTHLGTLLDEVPGVTTGKIPEIQGLSRDIDRLDNGEEKIRLGDYLEKLDVDKTSGLYQEFLGIPEADLKSPEMSSKVVSLGDILAEKTTLEETRVNLKGILGSDGLDTTKVNLDSPENNSFLDDTLVSLKVENSPALSDTRLDLGESEKEIGLSVIKKLLGESTNDTLDLTDTKISLEGNTWVNSLRDTRIDLEDSRKNTLGDTKVGLEVSDENFLGETRLNLEDTRDNNLEEARLDLEGHQENNLEDEVLRISTTPVESLGETRINLEASQENSLGEIKLSLDSSDKVESLEDKVEVINPWGIGELRTDILKISTFQIESLGDTKVDLKDIGDNSLDETRIDLKASRDNSLEGTKVNLEVSDNSTLGETKINLEDSRDNSLEDEVLKISTPSVESLEDTKVYLEDTQENTLDETRIDLEDSKDNSLKDEVLKVPAPSKIESLENTKVDLEDFQEQVSLSKVFIKKPDSKVPDVPKDLSDKVVGKLDGIPENITLEDIAISLENTKQLDSLKETIILGEGEIPENSLEDTKINLEDYQENNLEDEVLRISTSPIESLGETRVNLEVQTNNSLGETRLDLEDTRDNSLEKTKINLEDYQENNLEDEVLRISTQPIEALEDIKVNLEDTNESTLDETRINLGASQDNTLEDFVDTIEDPRENNLEDEILKISTPSIDSLGDTRIDLGNLSDSSLSETKISLEPPEETTSLEDTKISLEDTRDNSLRETKINLGVSDENSLEDTRLDLDDNRNNSLENTKLDLEVPDNNVLDETRLNLDDIRNNNLEDTRLDLEVKDEPSLNFLKETSPQNRNGEPEELYDYILGIEVPDKHSEKFENREEDKIQVEQEVLNHEYRYSQRFEENMGIPWTGRLDDVSLYPDKELYDEDIKEKANRSFSYQETLTSNLISSRRNYTKGNTGLIEGDHNYESVSGIEGFSLNPSKYNQEDRDLTQVEGEWKDIDTFPDRVDSKDYYFQAYSNILPNQNEELEELYDEDKRLRVDGNIKSDFIWESEKNEEERKSREASRKTGRLFHKSSNPNEVVLPDSIGENEELGENLNKFQISKEPAKEPSSTLDEYIQSLSDDEAYQKALEISREGKNASPEMANWFSKVSSAVSSYFSSPQMTPQRAFDYMNRISENLKSIRDNFNPKTTHNSDGTIYPGIPSYQLTKNGGILDALNINEYLRWLAENTVGKTLQPQVRRILLDETLAALILARDQAEKLSLSNRDRLPGGDIGLLTAAMRGGVSGAIDKGVSSLKTAASQLFEGAEGVDNTHPMNRPSTNIGGELKEKGIGITEYEKANDRDEKELNRSGLGGFVKSIAKSALGIGSGDTETYNKAYWESRSFKLTLKDLCPGNSVGADTTLEDLRSILESSPYITTPAQFGTITKGRYRTFSLDTNTYWEIIMQPFVSTDLNGGWSYLPAFWEINLENWRNHGVLTYYSSWVPINSFEIQKSKSTSKQLSLYEGEILYPIGTEFLNELRITIVDDSWKSWRRYFEKCFKVAVYNSQAHYGGDYYSDRDLEEGGIPTPIDETNLCIALYKNITFEFEIYIMNPQYNQIKKYHLLGVLKDFTEESIGEIDSGGTDLNVSFSIVGENPGSSSIQVLKEKKRTSAKANYDELKKQKKKNSGNNSLIKLL